MGPGRDRDDNRIVSNNGNGDFVLRAPPARAVVPMKLAAPPTLEEIVGFQAARIRELEAESEARTHAASTIANVACCLIDRLREYGYAKPDGSIFIPRPVEERIRGTQLTVAETPDGDIVVQMREQEKPAPVAWENRRDA